VNDASSPAVAPIGCGSGGTQLRGSAPMGAECVGPDHDASDLGAPDPGGRDVGAPDHDPPNPGGRDRDGPGPGSSDAGGLDLDRLTCRDRGAVRPRRRRPPVECGDLPFLILRDGTWLYRGSPIGRKELVCLFASVLRRDQDGGFWLETPVERGRIEVEDAPFVAVELHWTGTGTRQMLSFRTNVDQMVTAGPEHPIRISHDLLTCEPTPYITVRAGAGRLAVEARIARAVYYELVALGEPRWVGGQRVLGVWSAGSFFSLGELPPGDN